MNSSQTGVSVANIASLFLESMIFYCSMSNSVTLTKHSESPFVISLDVAQNVLFPLQGVLANGRKISTDDSHFDWNIRSILKLFVLMSIRVCSKNCQCIIPFLYIVDKVYKISLKSYPNVGEA